MKRGAVRHGAITMLLFALWASAQATDNRRKHVFIEDTACDSQFSSIVIASLRKNIRESEAYQLATSMKDSGGLRVVIAIYMICTEATLNSSERVASLATIFGFVRCDDASCHSATDEQSLGVFLCSGNRGVGCGRDIYTALADYMSKDGSLIFNSLSKEREHANLGKTRGQNGTLSSSASDFISHIGNAPCGSPCFPCLLGAFRAKARG